jgi:predicted transcriptional regulator
MNEAKEGDLRVWWIPQIPMKSFYVDVKNIEEAKLILKTLANYDLFQFKNKIKPDYSNAGGLQIFEKNHEGNIDWSDWYSQDGEDIDEVMKDEEYGNMP